MTVLFSCSTIKSTYIAGVIRNKPDVPCVKKQKLYVILISMNLVSFFVSIALLYVKSRNIHKYIISECTPIESKLSKIPGSRFSMKNRKILS